MTIKTKYNVGDDIWAIVEDKVHNLVVSEIRITTKGTGSISIEYTCYYGTLACYCPNGSSVAHNMNKHEFVLTEDKMFKTKKLLLKSL